MEQPPSNPGSADPPPLDILLVEDDAQDRAAVERLVEREALPWVLRTAATLEEARAELAEKDPDLIILDHHLPDGTGEELRGLLGDTPHIFVTAVGESEVAVAMMKKGASDFLMKDTGRTYIQLLSTAVDQALELHRLKTLEQQTADELEEMVLRRTEELKTSQDHLRRELALNAVLAEVGRALIRPDMSEGDLAALILDAAQSLTGSEHGFVSSVDPATGDNVGHTLKQMRGDPCKVETGQPVPCFPMRPDGTYGSLWGWAMDHRQAFFTNDPANDPRATGLPEGHIPLSNFLAAPALWGEEAVGLIALGNAFEAFTDDALNAVARLADLFSAALIQGRFNLEIRESRTRLRALTTRLQEVREEERAAISREIHDELGQQLTALLMDVSKLEKAVPEEDVPNRTALRDMRRLVDETLEMVRELAARLRPPVLDVLGLGAAVEWHLEEFRTQYGIETRLETEGDVDPGKGNVAIEAFRILQEALTNVARHAEATWVHVQLRSADGELVLEVVDNGIGIRRPADRSRNPLGLVGMQERAEGMGGRFQAGPRPGGSGTRITAHLPLRPATES